MQTAPTHLPPHIYLLSAASEAGAVAASAEERKKTKYASLNPAHTFTPVAIETSGVFGVRRPCPS